MVGRIPATISLDLSYKELKQLSQLAFAWVLRQSNVANALIEASKPEQVEENVKAVDVQLSDEVIEKLKRFLHKDHIG
ncbi:aldo/keto reductase [Bacillus sp. FSL W8-0116]|uniref:aldo/keto reductase n=1 Tax=Bacillus sp. FSL W8-0116 TaxID=2978206 RepID=UPI004046BDC7